MDCLAARRGLRLDDYTALHRWSIEQSDAFWFELAHFADVKAEWADAAVLVDGERMPGRAGSSAPDSTSPRTCCITAMTIPRSVFHNERGQRRTLS
jgi:hypothetical protein